MKQQHIAFHQDGHTMAFSYDHNTIFLLDTSTRKRFREYTHPHMVTKLVYSPTNALVIGDVSGTTTIVNASFETLKTFHTGEVHDIAITHQHIAIADSTTTLKITNIHNNNNTNIHSYGEFLSVAYNPQGSLLAAGDLVHMVYLFDTQTYNIVSKLPQTRYAYSIAFSPNGTIMAVGDDCGDTNIYNMHTKLRMHTFQQREHINRVAFYKNNMVAIATSIQYIHSSKYIQKGHILLYNIKQMTLLEKKEYDNAVTEVAFSNNNHLAYASHKGNVHISVIKV